MPVLPGFRKGRSRPAPAGDTALDAESDRLLAERVLAGDRQALAMLLDRHLGPVYRYLSAMFGPGNEQLVAEITRAVFRDAFTVRRLRPYARGRVSTPMRSALLRAANRQLAARRPASTVRVQATGPGDERAALRRAVLSLPARQRDALALALFENMAAEGLARTLGVGPARAMRLLRGALRRMDKLYSYGVRPERSP
jgi:DNA-directed RNA polymerase specialized sigma24 family protein